MSIRDIFSNAAIFWNLDYINGWNGPFNGPIMDITKGTTSIVQLNATVDQETDLGTWGLTITSIDFSNEGDFSTFITDEFISEDGGVTTTGVTELGNSLVDIDGNLVDTIAGISGLFNVSGTLFLRISNYGGIVESGKPGYKFARINIDTPGSDTNTAIFFTYIRTPVHYVAPGAFASKSEEVF